MLKIRFALLDLPLMSGQWVSITVFDATATDGEQAKLLSNLVEEAKLQTGIEAELSALGYVQDGAPMYYGADDVVQYLQKHGVPEWTHQIEV